MNRVEELTAKIKELQFLYHKKVGSHGWGHSVCAKLRDRIMQLVDERTLIEETGK